VYEGEPDADLATRPRSRRKKVALFLLPYRERLMGSRVIVYAPEQGDVFVAETDCKKQAS
jgi:hypothetical protein